MCGLRLTLSMLERFGRFSAVVLAAGALSFAQGPSTTAGHAPNSGFVRGFAKLDSIEGELAGLIEGGDNLGCSLSALGDVDGDGLCDMAAGARGDDDGGMDRGAVYV